MVLRFRRLRWVPIALMALSGGACVTPNDHGLCSSEPALCLGGSIDGPRDAGGAEPDAGAPDTATDTAVPPPRDAPADLAPAPDAAAPDAMAAECTPNAVDCTADNKVRTCSAQGRWMVTRTCAASDMCSAGVCLCAPGSCDEGKIHEIDAAPVAGSDLAASNQTIYLALSGLQPSIHRLEIRSPTEVRDTTLDFSGITHVDGACFNPLQRRSGLYDRELSDSGSSS